MNRPLPDRDTIDPNNATPLYKQLYQIILKAIEDGTFQPGDKIPSEDNLQKQFGLSRITIRKALQVLVDEETLMRIHGKGTFVTQGGFVGSFTASCLKMKVQPATHIISRVLEEAKPKIAEKLRIKAGENIIHIQRLRLMDGLPGILEQDYCPLKLGFLLESNLENASLFRLIREKLRIIPERFEDHFEICYASKKEAQLLGCDSGAALLRVTQLISVKGDILYYNEQLIRSDRYKYVIRYH